MKGVVVEIHDLKNATHLNGKRGFICEMLQKNPLKFSVQLDDQLLKIKNEKLLKVHCLGIPREYKFSDDSDDNDEFKFLLATLSQTNSCKFYVLSKQCGNKTTVFLVNTKFFKMAFDKMQTEPLLRIYITNKSHNDPKCKLMFEKACIDPIDDMSFPWYVDLNSSHLLELIARFDMITDETKLKNMNIHDKKKSLNA